MKVGILLVAMLIWQHLGRWLGGVGVSWIWTKRSRQKMKTVGALAYWFLMEKRVVNHHLRMSDFILFLWAETSWRLVLVGIVMGVGWHPWHVLSLVQSWSVEYFSVVVFWPNCFHTYWCQFGFVSQEFCRVASLHFPKTKMEHPKKLRFERWHSFWKEGLWGSSHSAIQGSPVTQPSSL